MPQVGREVIDHSRRARISSPTSKLTIIGAGKPAYTFDWADLCLVLRLRAAHLCRSGILFDNVRVLFIMWETRNSASRLRTPASYNLPPAMHEFRRARRS